jgi:hypothetical protein
MIVSLISLLVDAALAYFASRTPVYVEVLETISGSMLIAGLALVGIAAARHFLRHAGVRRHRFPPPVLVRPCSPAPGRPTPDRS